MDENRLLYLLKQYFDNTITKSDCEELLKLLDEGRASEISAAIDQTLTTDSPSETFSPSRKNHVYNQLISEIHERQSATFHTPTTRKNRFISYLKIAAVFTAIISIGIWLHHITRPDIANLQSDLQRDSILLPDRNQAILTLADGSTIVLDDAASGVLAQESGIKIRRSEDGSIFYEASASQANIKSDASKYNTFSTPKGSTYRILLPDGTTVWLNTGSSIRYPVIFNGNERHVSLTGEAYFEVAHDSTKPFLVEANGSTIRVLGTHFNISAYADEKQTTTTLVEGSVNVSRNGNTVTLKPNQQAIVDMLTGKIHQSTADVRSAVAWKNGYFRFDEESIEDIIEKISRWYDIEAVEYQGQFNDRFTGTFQRSKNVSQLFSNLEKLAPIRFEIKERRVVIMK